MPLDIDKIRADFPILQTEVHKHPLVYLDNAATTQKPLSVIEAERTQYLEANANVHRGVHHLSEIATDRMEQARDRVRRFIGAGSTAEVIFTRGTTEAINLVASSYGELLSRGDTVLVSAMEHHSNIVPWQLLRERRGINLRVIPMHDDGSIDLDAYRDLLADSPKLVCIAHVSNVLGTVNPVAEMTRMAHDAGAKVLVDGAQSTPHMPIDVRAIGCDFFAMSGHKVYGPTGIGALYGREELLDLMPPYQGGGEMISTVSFERTVFERLPYKFEAGTPNYVGAVALAAALDYVSALGMDEIAAYEHTLLAYATERLQAIPGLRIYGTAPGKEGVISFLVKDIHHLDMGTLLDRLGIAVRTGHHCAEPVMARMGIEGTVRASFSFYNTREEVELLARGIERVASMF